MASEITEEEEEEENGKPFRIEDKEAERIRIKQIIDYQKSLYFYSSASSSFSSAAATTSSSCTSPRKSSSLLDLMKEGSTSLGRLFDMGHISLGNYLKDYSVSPIIKPILLWGSDSDNDNHDHPWAGMKQMGGAAFESRIGDQVVAQQGIMNDKDFMQQGRRKKKGPKKID